MKKPHNKNLCKHPLDPEYDDDFDYESEMERYMLEKELEEEQKLIDKYINNR